MCVCVALKLRLRGGSCGYLAWEVRGQTSGQNLSTSPFFLFPLRAMNFRVEGRENRNVTELKTERFSAGDNPA